MFDIPKIVVLDFEGTSLQSDRCATEIGLVALDLDLNEIGRYESIVNPWVAPSAKALEIAGLTLHDLRGAPRMRDIWPNFAHYFSKAVLVMHNAEYDLQIVHNELVEPGLMPRLPQSECTYLRSKSYFAKSITGTHQLKDMCNYFGIVNERAHSALSDAVATSELLLKLIEHDSSLYEALIRKANQGLKVDNLRPVSTSAQARPKKSPPKPVSEGVVRSFGETELHDIAREIRRNGRVEYVNVTGDLSISFEELNRLLRPLGLYFKETPTTMKCAFLIVGSTGIGGSKIEKARKYQRPIVMEDDAYRLIEILQGR